MGSVTGTATVTAAAALVGWRVMMLSGSRGHSRGQGHRSRMIRAQRLVLVVSMRWHRPVMLPVP